MQPSNAYQTYDQLFADIDRGRIKVPKFQREFVWSKEQTAGLLDSLIKGYPIGTFIYWTTHDELRYQKEVGNFALPPIEEGFPVSYVLDGQQRITSLYAARKGVVFTRENNQRIDYKDIVVDLSLDPDSDDQVVFASSIKSSSMISVHDLLNISIVSVVKSYSEAQLKHLEDYKGRFGNYNFSTITIGAEYSIDVATEIFVRINTGGTHLDLFEIMVAKTYSEKRNFDLLQRYENLMDTDGTGKDLKRANYDTIPKITILQCVAICLGEGVRRQDILRLDKDGFIDIWEDVKASIFAAVDFLRSHLKVPVSNLLPYNALLTLLTYFFFKSGGNPTVRQAKLLTRYFWWASLARRYSASADSNITADRKKIDRILKDEQPSYRGEEVDLNESKLRDYEFSTSDAFCKAILCLYVFFQPKSFDTARTVIVDNSWLAYRNSKNYHHFFPISYLTKTGHEDWQANSIMNITIVDDFLNKHKIRAKAPSVYMKEYSDSNAEISDAMRSHLIDDLSAAGVWNDDYKKFLDIRAKRVMKEINKRLNPRL